jgi:hypothetical protein
MQTNHSPVEMKAASARTHTHLVSLPKKKHFLSLPFGLPAWSFQVP